MASSVVEKTKSTAIIAAITASLTFLYRDIPLGFYPNSC